MQKYPITTIARYGWQDQHSQMHTMIRIHMIESYGKRGHQLLAVTTSFGMVQVILRTMHQYQALISKNLYLLLISRSIWYEY